MDHVVGFVSEKSSLNPGHLDFSSVLEVSQFCILHLGSVTYFELSFMKERRSVFRLTFSPCRCLVIPAPFFGGTVQKVSEQLNSKS